VREQRGIGFTDISVVLPHADGIPVLRRIAADVIPELRSEGVPGVSGAAGAAAS
jgi:hypothetical protein